MSQKVAAAKPETLLFETDREREIGDARFPPKKEMQKE